MDRRGVELIGTVLEHRYRVEALLARGGMSAVYRGVDTRLDRAVAIKVMDPRFSGDRNFTDRFEREARAAAGLHHPGIVAVHDQGVDRRPDGDHVFIVMELVEGGTLRDLLREQGALPVPVALSVLEPVLSALAAAHNAGLVHRDIKPENVLIGPGGVLKVADFGLVRAVAEAGTTSASVILGTVAYLAPEQVTTGAADARSDVYTAGVVLYEMLVGSPPYTGDHALSVAYRHVNDDVPAPGTTVAGIPAELDDLVVRATRRDATVRPPDAAAFLLELQRVRTVLGIQRVSVPTPTPTHEPNAFSIPPNGSGPGASALSPGAPEDTGSAGGAAEFTSSSSTGIPAADDPPTERIPPVVDPVVDEDRTVRLSPIAGAGDPTAVQPMPPAPRAAPVGPQGTRALARTPAAATRRPTGQRRPPRKPAPKPSRRGFTLAIIAVLVLAAVVGAVAWWTGSGRWTSVPKVTGLEQASAERALREADLVPQIRQENHDQIDQGRVIRTDPAIGAETLRGSEVTLVVSKGRPRVPEVASGTAQSDAEQAIREALLQPRIDQNANEFSDTVPTGRVVRLDPRPGTPLPAGTAVTVVLSKGAKPKPVPDVRGQDRDQAFQVLRRAGFEPFDAGTDFSEDVEAGKVVTTKPGPGELVEGDQNKRVGVVVSNAVTVPNVTGSQLKDAQKALEDLGLKVDAKGFRPGRNSVVINQSERPGSKVKPGTEIELDVFP
ncbi:serine/threonine protein kinase [Longimycelium tulufanense]|uniref:non-specific serine/threonine protein kinase n=1 Tax=Longimycelium tulufanense TaxID=907463 RepID=A0A8J3CD36_9PSEU|nr:Stk1 family PASTA domain-containing Ser/Thr kinase [Longimycelium tulufanense]GGM61567.1 serine/threonine protein kinase [Longimycelium tulufanense]